jgi:hypothetical protein
VHWQVFEFGFSTSLYYIFIEYMTFLVEYDTPKTPQRHLKDTQGHPRTPKDIQKIQRHPKTPKDIQEIQRHPKTSKATPEEPRVPKMLWEIYNYLGCSVSKGDFPDVLHLSFVSFIVLLIYVSRLSYGHF